ncbi:hypothetical protein PPUN109347_02090 [Pseudomonas putida]|nr:hypothetical protein D0O09_15145 [Pseudomonas putida]GLO43647.1 hypothetical protein PPUN109347_02090 [Pseudomonas putida]
MALLRPEWALILYSVQNPCEGFALVRGLARSHRATAAPESGAIPVGAGKPAKGRKAAPAYQFLEPAP